MTFSQYLDSLAELIRKGIEAANEDLRKANDARLQHEGVMRQLPLMGSIVNWLSPIQHESIKGRSFNLKTGEILESDIMYKQRGGEKVPMTPIDTPQEPHGKPVEARETAPVAAAPEPQASTA